MQENEVLRAALDRLNIKPIAAARLFGVSRITVYNWIVGKHAIPKDVFTALLDTENRNYASFMERQKAITQMAEDINAGKITAPAKRRRRKADRPE